MRRELIRIEDVADLRNLVWAYHRASRGKRGRPDVARFEADLYGELNRLAREILDGTIDVGAARRFVIHDPKRRTIHAPVFRERVLHHALMRFVAPPLERALVDDTFACRPRRGSLACVERARIHLRRHPLLVKVDVRRFFDSVDHAILLGQLARRIRGERVLALCRRIVSAYATAPGKGLPIGALTSQHFANSYLAPLDRHLLERLRVRGMVRYMDDVVWWCRSRAECIDTLRDVRAFLACELALVLKTSVQIRPSRQGVTLCGYQLRGSAVRLSLRRRQRSERVRRAAERAYAAGWIDGRELQTRGDVALAITAHADARAWRRTQLERRPPPDA